MADTTPFSTIYTVETEPAGEVEVEQWSTWLGGKSRESFNALEGRTEVEYGVTDDFQIAGYVSYDWARDRPHGAATPDEAQNGLDFRSFSAEAIYRLVDPDTHPFGLALYVEPAIGPGYREIEAKLLVQKNFLDDRLVLAGNAVLENEWNLMPPDPSATLGSLDATRHWARETELNLLAGAAYRFAPAWSGGVEFAAQREIDGLLFWQRSSAAATSYFVGPTLHFNHEAYWLTIGAQAQLPWAANLSGEPGETVRGFAHEEERYRIRLRIGFDL